MRLSPHARNQMANDRLGDAGLSRRTCWPPGNFGSGRLQNVSTAGEDLGGLARRVVDAKGTITS
jgi:hypothetical protein